MSPRTSDESANGGANGSSSPFVVSRRLERERLNFLLAQRLRVAAAAAGRGVLRFKRDVEVYLIEHHSSYSEDERISCWYSDADLRVIMNDTKSTVRAVRRQQSGRGDSSAVEVQDEICDRGLEPLRSAAHMERRKINRDCAFESVLGEQRRQRREGIVDGDELRRASERGSLWATNQALLLARRDAKEAASIREDDKREALASIAGQYAALGQAVRGIGGSEEKEDGRHDRATTTTTTESSNQSSTTDTAISASSRSGSEWRRRPSINDAVLLAGSPPRRISPRSFSSSGKSSAAATGVASQRTVLGRALEVSSAAAAAGGRGETAPDPGLSCTSPFAAAVSSSSSRSAAASSVRLHDAVLRAGGSSSQSSPSGAGGGNTLSLGVLLNGHGNNNFEGKPSNNDGDRLPKKANKAAEDGGNNGSSNSGLFTI